MLGPKRQVEGERRAEMGGEECPGRDHCILAGWEEDYAAKHASLADSCELNSMNDCRPTDNPRDPEPAIGWAGEREEEGEERSRRE